jgi:hypothetical protein
MRTVINIVLSVVMLLAGGALAWAGLWAVKRYGYAWGGMADFAAIVIIGIVLGCVDGKMSAWHQGEKDRETERLERLNDAN